MMNLKSRQLGRIEVDEESIIDVPEGLVGFEDLHRFCLVRRDEYRPFFWLISIQDPDVGFAVVDPEPFVTEPYAVVLNESDRRELDLREGDPVHVLVIVSPGENHGPMTLNLKGPLLLNPRNRVMRQLLMYSAKLPSRAPLHAMGATDGASVLGRKTAVRIVDKRAA